MISKLNAFFHLWAGLISGIIVFILSITGCILVFEQEIKSLSSPWLHVQKQPGDTYLPPSVLYSSVKKMLPDAELGSVWYKGENSTAYFSIDHSDSLVYVNPYTAEVVAIKSHEDFFHFVEEGHTYLWLPPSIGKPVVSWATFIFFLLIITGLVLWFPRKWNKRNIQQAFTVKWKARFKRLNYDLHNVLGFYSLTVALIFAFTGLLMGFAWFSNGVFWLTGGEAKQEVPVKSGVSFPGHSNLMQQVDRAWYKAIYEIGKKNKDNVIVGFPEEPGEAIYLCVDMSGGSWRYVYLDQYTLNETAGTQPRLGDDNLANQIRRINYGLHVGEIGGIPTKIIYFIASLICASLPVTGFLVWWGKRKKGAALEKPLPRARLITA